MAILTANAPISQGARFVFLTVLQLLNRTGTCVLYPALQCKSSAGDAALQGAAEQGGSAGHRAALVAVPAGLLLSGGADSSRHTWGVGGSGRGSPWATGHVRP